MAIEFADFTESEKRIVQAIVDRADQYGILETRPDRVRLRMDLAATHAKYPLRLGDLLAADKFNFLHDIGGISAHMNRSTGLLDNGFFPRFAVRDFDRPASPVIITGSESPVECVVTAPARVVAWRITKDHITAAPGEDDQTGRKGGHSDPPVPLSQRFRIYDDDGVLYFEGVATPDAEFEPLDWAQNYAGATEIRYKTGRRWERL